MQWKHTMQQDHSCFHPPHPIPGPAFGGPGCPRGSELCPQYTASQPVSLTSAGIQMDLKLLSTTRPWQSRWQDGRQCGQSLRTVSGVCLELGFFPPCASVILAHRQSRISARLWTSGCTQVSYRHTCRVLPKLYSGDRPPVNVERP